MRSMTYFPSHSNRGIRKAAAMAGSVPTTQSPLHFDPPKLQSEASAYVYAQNARCDNIHAPPPSLPRRLADSGVLLHVCEKEWHFLPRSLQTVRTPATCGNFAFFASSGGIAALPPTGRPPKVVLQTAPGRRTIGPTGQPRRGFTPIVPQRGRLSQSSSADSRTTRIVVTTFPDRLGPPLSLLSARTAATEHECQATDGPHLLI